MIRVRLYVHSLLTPKLGMASRIGLGGSENTLFVTLLNARASSSCHRKNIACHTRDSNQHKEGKVPKRCPWISPRIPQKTKQSNVDRVTEWETEKQIYFELVDMSGYGTLKNTGPMGVGDHLVRVAY